MCVSQDQLAKHQILPRSSSEAVQSVHEAERCHTEENTLEQDQTETDHVGDYYADTHTHTDIKDKMQEKVLEENGTNDQSLETEESDAKKETNVESVEREKENTDTSR